MLSKGKGWLCGLVALVSLGISGIASAEAVPIDVEKVEIDWVGTSENIVAAYSSYLIPCFGIALFIMMAWVIVKLLRKAVNGAG